MFAVNKDVGANYFCLLKHDILETLCIGEADNSFQ